MFYCSIRRRCMDRTLAYQWQRHQHGELSRRSTTYHHLRRPRLPATAAAPAAPAAFIAGGADAGRREFRVNESRVTSLELRVTSHESRVSSHELRVTSRERCEPSRRPAVGEWRVRRIRGRPGGSAKSSTSEGRRDGRQSRLRSRKR